MILSKECLAKEFKGSLIAALLASRCLSHTILSQITFVAALACIENKQKLLCLLLLRGEDGSDEVKFRWYDGNGIVLAFGNAPPGSK